MYKLFKSFKIEIKSNLQQFRKKYDGWNGELRQMESHQESQPNPNMIFVYDLLKNQVMYYFIILFCYSALR